MLEYLGGIFGGYVEGVVRRGLGGEEGVGAQWGVLWWGLGLGCIRICINKGWVCGVRII